MTFDKDVKHPLYQQAEERALAYLRRRYQADRVVDCRQNRDEAGRRVPWDFEIVFGRDAVRLDVKIDRWIAREGMVHYEYEHEHYAGRERGRRRGGWGADTRLDFVLYVNHRSWSSYLVPLRSLRTFIYDRTDGGARQPVGWIHNCHDNADRGYRTWFWAIPFAELLEEGLVVEHHDLAPFAGVGMAGVR